jgi:hypothetical protein
VVNEVAQVGSNSAVADAVVSVSTAVVEDCSVDCIEAGRVSDGIGSALEDGLVLVASNGPETNRNAS